CHFRSVRLIFGKYVFIQKLSQGAVKLAKKSAKSIVDSRKIKRPNTHSRRVGRHPGLMVLIPKGLFVQSTSSKTSVQTEFANFKGEPPRNWHSRRNRRVVSFGSAGGLSLLSLEFCHASQQVGQLVKSDQLSFV